MKYFISFSYVDYKTKTTGFGNGEIEVDFKIRNIEHLRKIKERIEKEQLSKFEKPDVIILNYIRLKG